MVSTGRGETSRGADDGGPGLVVSEARVRFGSLTAVDGVDLTVAPGEIVALVGPSGCGKSTLLRAVAGLEVLDHGTVSWDGTEVTATPVHERGFGLMFQDDALFPHRDVADNVAFGLRTQGLSRTDRHRRVAEVLEMVGLAGFDRRTIDTLSGGEAQRVALARALAPSPRLLMLDEPLGSLDRTLRDRLAQDLRSVLRELGLAAVHVTHDQEEAYAVADRLVVMKEGAVVRDGPVAEVWADPGTGFVARFLGHENILDRARAALLGLELADDADEVVVRESALAVLARPDDRAVPQGRGTVVDAEVVDVRFRGATSHVTVHLGDRAGGGGPTVLTFHSPRPPVVGQKIGLLLDPSHITPLRG